MTVSTPLASPQVRDKLRMPQWLEAGPWPLWCLFSCIVKFPLCCCARAEACLAHPSWKDRPTRVPTMGCHLGSSLPHGPPSPHWVSSPPPALSPLWNSPWPLPLPASDFILPDSSWSQSVSAPGSAVWNFHLPLKTLATHPPLTWLSSAPMSSSSPPLISCCSLIGAVLGPLSSWFSPLLF